VDPGITSGLLQLISAAVTPVVLISACAALILGVNNKHTAIADRLRTFAAELRGPDRSSDRDAQVSEQIAIFFRRFRLTWMALAVLYGAVVAFVCMILILVLAQKHLLAKPFAALPLFIVGICFMMTATVFEMVEVGLSIDCIKIELRDVTDR